MLLPSIVVCFAYLPARLCFNPVVDKTVHDPVVVHRVRHAFVHDSADYRQSAVPQAENGKRRTRGHIGRVRVHHVLCHVFRQTGRIPVGAHQNATRSNREQNVPQPLHTDTHTGHAVLHRHDNRLGAAQNEKLFVQNQQGKRRVLTGSLQKIRKMAR